MDLASEKDRVDREILPRLKRLSIMVTAEATGFSRRYSSLVRKGLYVPDPAHSEELARLLGAAVGQSA
ncbi:MAG: hypothetical protein A2V67_10095 [Deltaproteobacteria bacterium RBG_13_61_14]|nr:MAG: hypothetical protein A2V67_10095 [Deltaproteobacteria bacterium RBG_13_61_14]